MALSTFELYEILRDRLGDKEAQTLAHYVEDKVNEKWSEAKSELATKADVTLSGTELKVEMNNLKAEFHRTQANHLKWVIGLWIANMLAIVAALLQR